MAKIKVTAFVYMGYKFKKDFSGKEWKPEIWCAQVADHTDRIFVGEQIASVEIPENFNPVPSQVAVLEREKLAALEAYQKSVANINYQLSKLLAITNEVVGS